MAQDNRGFTLIEIQTAWGALFLPDFGDNLDVTDKLRLTWHWSAGSYQAGDRSLTHYHVLAEEDGRVKQGVPIAQQIVTKDYERHPGYARHVRNGNANNIAISAMAMADSHEHQANRGDYGQYPLTAAQVEFLVEVTAQICYFYDIPVIPARVLGHAEWRTVLGIHQDRWDVCCIPHLDIRPNELPDGTFESHNYLRRRVRQRIVDLARGAVKPEKWRAEIADINGHLGPLYELVGKLPLSAQDKQEAIAGLNAYNRVLLDSGLKPLPR